MLEPAYTILNTRFVYEPPARNFAVEIWGKNLLDELYVNGGFDTRDTWGYDFSIVGRSREVGVGHQLRVLTCYGPAASPNRHRGGLRAASSFPAAASAVPRLPPPLALTLTVRGSPVYRIVAAARRIGDDLVAHRDREIRAAAAVHGRLHRP